MFHLKGPKAIFSFLVLGLILFCPSAVWGKNKSLCENLPLKYKKKVESIVESPSILCQVENRVQTRKFVYEYLLDRLEFTAQILRSMNLAKYDIKAGPDKIWKIDDHRGARATVTLIKGEKNRRIYFARGVFETPILPEVHGQGVVVLHYREVRKNLLECKAEFYFRFSSQVLHRITKALRLLLRKTIDKKSQKIVRAAEKISEEIQKNPEKVYREIASDPSISRRRLREFKLLFVKRHK